MNIYVENPYHLYNNELIDFLEYIPHIRENANFMEI